VLFDPHSLVLLSTSATDLTKEGGLIGLVARIIDALSYPGISLLIAAESIIPPIPSEAILPMAGFLAASGTFNFFGVLVAATLGSVVGASALYGAGWYLGRTRILTLIDRYGSKIGVGLDDVHRAEEWFRKYGRVSVLIGRLVPIVRSLVSIPAGFYHMSFAQFLVYTTVGSLAWNTLLVGAGYLLEDHWDRVGPYVEIFQYVVIVIAVLLIGRFVYRRWRAAASSHTTTPSQP
jgi:membrane protein DedA with SNARE-associated domain